MFPFVSHFLNRLLAALFLEKIRFVLLWLILELFLKGKMASHKACGVLAAIGDGEFKQEFDNTPTGLKTLALGELTGAARAENNVGLAVRIPAPPSPACHEQTITAQVEIVKHLFCAGKDPTLSQQYGAGVETGFRGKVMVPVPVNSLQGKPGHPDPHRESVQLFGPTSFGKIEVTQGVFLQKHAVAPKQALLGFDSPKMELAAKEIWHQTQELLEKGCSLDFSWLQDPREEWKDEDYNVTFADIGLTDPRFIEHIQFLLYWIDPETNEPMTALPISVYSAIHGSTDDPNKFTKLEACFISGQVNSWKKNKPIS